MALIEADSIVAPTGSAVTLIERQGAADDLNVNDKVMLVAFTGQGIEGLLSGHDVTVSGLVSAGVFGIVLGDDRAADGFETVRIRAGGEVSANSLLGVGVFLQAHDSLLENAGRILGATGVLFGGVGAGQSQLLNSGFIYAGGTCVEVQQAATEAIVIQNTGRMISPLNIMTTSDLMTGAITFVNKGLLIGRFVAFGGGDDLYDGRLGRILNVNGLAFLPGISGGSGSDRFIPGLSAEAIAGDSGFDTLDFSLSAGITVALDGAYRNTLTARGDDYFSLEELKGSLKGADILRGAAGDEIIWGQGGADRIEGGDGHDTLIGGTGGDRLTGEDGNDIFLYNSLAEVGDRITDFKNNAYGDDVIQISRAGFGLSALPLGFIDPSWFRASTSNAAEDGNDRFIFRTTDKTLWLDGDGNGVRKPVLIADLQASAILGAGDIFLVN